MTLRKTPFQNIVGKGENASNQHILLYPQCIHPFQTKFQFSNHSYFVLCKCSKFGSVYNFVVWRGVKQTRRKIIIVTHLFNSNPFKDAISDLTSPNEVSFWPEVIP